MKTVQNEKRKRKKSATSRSKRRLTRRMKHKTFILALEKDDPERELEFELDFQASLTTQERFEMMFRRSREVAEHMSRDGYPKTPAIVKRP